MENQHRCPKCGSIVYYVYGYCMDYDKIICQSKECNYQKELSITTYPKVGD